MMTVEQAAAQARKASWELSSLSAQVRNGALGKMTQKLWENREAVYAANREDLALGREEGLAAPLMARLSLDEKKLSGVIEGLRQLQACRIR